MKVIFVDIDGVLNSSRSFAVMKSLEDEFDPIAIKLIKKIVELTGAEIVISSSWRVSTKREDLEKLIGLEIYDYTPIKLTALRGEEIAQWLRQHEVEKYAIVDDTDEMLEDQRPYFTQTEFSQGLSYKNYKDILKILGYEYDKS